MAARMQLMGATTRMGPRFVNSMRWADLLIAAGRHAGRAPTFAAVQIFD
jgi:hypothetical protein